MALERALGGILRTTFDLPRFALVLSVVAVIGSVNAAPAFAEKCRDGVYHGRYGFQVNPRGPDASNIPTGDPKVFYTPEEIEEWADRIIQYPKKVERSFRSEFEQVAVTNTGVRVYNAVFAPAMVAQLAGWKQNDRKSVKAKKAYAGARRMVMDIYDQAELADEGAFQDRMIATTANIHGLVTRKYDIGTAYVKADWMAFLGDRVRRAEKEKKRAIAGATAKHLTWLLFACESGTMLEYIAPFPKRRTYGGELTVKLDRILAAPMIYRSYGAEAAIAQSLARISVQVAKAAKRAMEKDDSKDSRVARNKAWVLGQVLAHLDVALWKHVRSARKDKASIEHGAKIVRYSLKAIDLLTGGASKPGTKMVRQGVDWLEKNEKAAEASAEKKSFTDVRSKMVETAVLAFQIEVGDVYADVVNKPELLEWVRQFRTNVLAGHKDTMTEKFSSVKLPGTLDLASY